MRCYTTSTYYNDIINTTDPDLADERAALQKAEAHDNTPQIAFLDTLGRQFLVRNVMESGNLGAGLDTHTKFGVFQFRPDFVDRLHVILDAPSADIG